MALLLQNNMAGGIRLFCEWALAQILVSGLSSAESWPRAASLVPGEVFTQGSSRHCEVCNAVLSWGV